ncbi:MAG: hypothetical protein HN472_14740 [Nitrospina sp.]|jgi:bisphosphoglycerate-dependent phosphoglycerate mutase|nr:hypothetical protein [Nitrospina sp.]MBT3876218.1 hypothetical protein [Nitrospina sp.]MBT4048748.1 hypothetical protein [Nitrospina sp.]MBT4556548.1 hypothetical protein [Nitrospina sp.]MBT5347411.1 hypothetical protein [Nitrospina sp.]
MNRIYIQIFIGWLFSLLVFTAWADVDLMDAGKSDSAVKMLVFPKSLRVIENRTTQIDRVHAFPFDPKGIRKTLLKVDPARIVPARAGEPFFGPVTRDRLRDLAKQYSEDVILIFRRNQKAEPKNIAHIHYQGLLYLARQNKVLALRDYEKKAPEEHGAESWRNLDNAGLKSLAKEARKILHSYKFEKRQSAY